VLEWGAARVSAPVLGRPQYLPAQPTGVMGRTSRGGGRSGEGTTGKGRMRAGVRARRDEPPAPPPHPSPQSIHPRTLTRRRVCKVEMMSEAEKS
jgi:hypothetical protein